MKMALQQDKAGQIGRWRARPALWAWLVAAGCTLSCTLNGQPEEPAEGNGLGSQIPVLPGNGPSTEGSGNDSLGGPDFNPPPGDTAGPTTGGTPVPATGPGTVPGGAPATPSPAVPAEAPQEPAQPSGDSPDAGTLDDAGTVSFQQETEFADANDAAESLESADAEEFPEKPLDVLAE
jgi:hypothetical protein